MAWSTRARSPAPASTTGVSATGLSIGGTRPCGERRRRHDQLRHHHRQGGRRQRDRDPHRRRRERAADRQRRDDHRRGAGAGGCGRAGDRRSTAGATVNAISNSGTIAATRAGDSGTAAAIVDHSGTRRTDRRTTARSASPTPPTSATTRPRSTCAQRRRRDRAPDRGGNPAARAARSPGNICLGAGNDTLDIQAGNVFGKVDFGGGADILSLSGTSVFRGSLVNSAGPRRSRSAPAPRSTSRTSAPSTSRR